MGISNLKKKNVANGKKSKATFLKVNKYENSDMALSLIAHICTKDTDLSVEDSFKPYKERITSMRDRFLKKENIDEKKGDVSIDRIGKKDNDGLKEACLWAYQKLPDEIENTNGHSSQTIDVCGGYSSGKSSFLNNLLETKNALPTGIEPVSMINTYINCPKDATQLTVTGRNVKGNLVRLNREVLDCIQHSSKTKVYVGSVLDTLYINMPLLNHKDFLQDLTFVDTPGYNNSENTNAENNQRDKDTAQDAMKKADAIIWCIDIGAGAISKEDIAVINSGVDERKDCPILIVFTKMDRIFSKDEYDKDSFNEVMSILKVASQTCDKYLKVKPIDIIAYSDRKKANYCISFQASQYGYKGDNSAIILKSTFELLKNKALKPQGVDYWCNKVKSYFDQEIEASNDQLNFLERQRLRLVDEKDEAYRKKGENNQESSYNLEDIKDMLLDNYDELEDEGKFLNDLLNQEIDECNKAINREYEWASQAGFFSSISSLRGKQTMAFNRHNKLLAKYNNYDFPQVWGKDYRKDTYDIIKRAIEFYNNANDVSESIEQQYNDVVDLKNQFERYVSFLKEEQIETVRLLRDCSKKALAEIDNRIRKMQTVKQVEETNIFAAIANDNVPRFLECFSSGVELSDCNEQGFSPITYVARCSNNVMMKFFIRHEVDLTMKDKRGYNALETAAIYHCQDICELLLKADNNLIYESQNLGELADNTKFKDWISKY